MLSLTVPHFTPTQKSLSDAFHIAVENGWAVAVWRLPNQKEWHLVVDFTEQPTKHSPKNPLQTKINIENSTAGFAVSPFLSDHLQETYFIKADVHLEFSEKSTKKSTENEFLKTFKISQTEERFWKLLQKNDSKQKNTKSVIPVKKIVEDISQKTHFQEIIKKAVQKIKEKDFLKVVLSREQVVVFEQEPDAFMIFEKLSELYPTAFVSLWHIPEVGTWAGATPETLVSLNKNLIFKTMALAGTQAYTSEKTTSNAVWTQKEIEEQALVSRYIINSFKKVRVREFEEDGPKTVIAGNLMHLQTDFWIDIQAISYPQLPDILLELLHPTSAVCGMPKQEAMAFILENEGYSRSFYSGFLGPVNISGETNLFVNLRCMELFSDFCKIYVGCGITEDSQPEKEWNETVLKAQTILRVFAEK